ncbi:MAG: hypothetical protein ACP5OF_01540 [bacterium]
MNNKIKIVLIGIIIGIGMISLLLSRTMAYDTNGAYDSCSNFYYIPNFYSGFNLPSPATPTPTTYQYNGFNFSIPASAISSDSNFFTWTASAGYNVPDLQIKMSEGANGRIPYFLFLTKDGLNGINNGTQRGFYLESYAYYTFLVPYNNSIFVIGSNVYGHATGSPVVLYGSPSILASSIYGATQLLLQYKGSPFTVTANNSNYSQTGMAITLATNAGLGISTLTQNNAIMNTGPIYPRNPSNIAQTLTQPTIVTVYDNDLAGLSYTGWTTTGSGFLVSGVLTVNMGLSYDSASAYKCTANYDGVPSGVAGILAITRSTGSQFVITSVSSTGAVNTSDTNKVQYTCIGY